jgi:hypothetical protein
MVLMVLAFRYEDYKSRIAKSEFAEDVEMTSPVHGGGGRSGGGGGGSVGSIRFPAKSKAAGAAKGSYAMAHGGGGGDAPTSAAEPFEAAGGEAATPEGLAFLEAAGLGAFWAAFEATAVRDERKQAKEDRRTPGCSTHGAGRRPMFLGASRLAPQVTSV